MAMTMLMLILWQGKGNEYEESFKRSAEAEYQISDIKQYFDNATKLVRKEFPLLTGTLPLAYAVGVRKQVRLTSRKLNIMPNSSATYQYNVNNKSGSVVFTWGF